MQVKQNGQFIILQDPEDWAEAMELRCRCGASLISHEHGFTAGSRTTLQVGACRHCNCQQFSVRTPKKTGFFSYAGR